MTDDGGQMTDDGGPMTEDGGQMTDDGGQMPDDGGQRTEDRGQESGLVSHSPFTPHPSSFSTSPFSLLPFNPDPPGCGGYARARLRRARTASVRCRRRR